MLRQRALHSKQHSITFRVQSERERESNGIYAVIESTVLIQNTTQNIKYLAVDIHSQYTLPGTASIAKEI